MLREDFFQKTKTEQVCTCYFVDVLPLVKSYSIGLAWTVSCECIGKPACPCSVNCCAQFFFLVFKSGLCLSGQCCASPKRDLVQVADVEFHLLEATLSARIDS